jgi:lipid-A-disaccharide synthase-like uncharacterized protein
MILTAHELDEIWLAIGMIGQLMFFMRFLFQWLASEKAKKSTIPDVFWYFSVAGGLILFVYAIHKADPVFILGQGTGILIYIRNIHLIHAQRKLKLNPAADPAADREEAI